MSPNDPLASISDTAAWIAAYRAREHERPDGILHDPFARALAGPEGQAVLEGMGDADHYAWPFVVRTVLIDEHVRELAARGALDAVVDLGAGYDSRPFRLELPPDLIWTDVDTEAVIERKAAALAEATPTCRYVARAMDFVRGPSALRALFSSLPSGERRTLVLSEGVLIYLTEAQVHQLGQRLAAEPAAGWWVTDLASPELMRRLDASWGSELRSAGAPLRFAPAEGTGFFARSGWIEERYTELWDAARALYPDTRLAPGPVSPSARYSGIVRLRPGASLSDGTWRP